MPPVLVWFRDDLRLDDHPALSAAAASAEPVIPVFVFEDNDGQRPLGGASRWWLHHSLTAHAARLEECGTQLVIRRGKACEEIPKLLAETGATIIHWNRRYRPQAVAIDTALKADLTAKGMKAISHPGSLLKEPFTLLNGQGLPYKVFTPYWRALRASGPFAAPLSSPQRMNGWTGVASLSLDELGLPPKSPNWAAPFTPLWQPGEQGAQARLQDFLDHSLAVYADQRDQPAKPSTSRLSPHLRFGEISPNRIVSAVDTHIDECPSLSGAADKFLSEIGWREFSTYLLWHFPTLPSKNFNARFDCFPWRSDEVALQAWQRGATGIPIIDAGMRELWQTGTMHNRVRMLVASFLTKNLMIDWRQGEGWFFDTLLDADEANNAASWQWVAGSGADAAPYFRVFNPVTQGEKFDPEGLYVRRFVPELAALPSKHIHNPLGAPAMVLAEANIRLGETYPLPLADLGASRERALHAFKNLNAG